MHGRLDDVVQHRAVAEEVEVLEHHADVAALLRGVLLAHLVQHAVAIVIADQLAVDVEAAGVDLLQVVHAAQQGGLAGAGRADQAGDLAGVDLQVDAFEHVEVAEGLPHVHGLDHWRLLDGH